MAKMVIESESSEEEQDPREQRAAMEVANGESDAEDSDGPPSSAKRRRMNGTEPSPTQDGPADAPAPRRRQLARDTDDFVTGSIVRMACENFLTYDSVEFTLGPRLNMIIGPNGTGKSSIVCAVAVGLGFDPKLLGRAPKVEAFVKTHKLWGSVEIELKGKPGGNNMVIKRTFHSKTKRTRQAEGKAQDKATADGKPSKGSKKRQKDVDEESEVEMEAESKVSLPPAGYTINGKPATQATVKSKVAGLDVDISNLCSFLPQDRVGEFTKVNAQDLLKKTQSIAGDVKLTEWHDALIKRSNEHKNERVKLEETEKQLQQANDILRSLQKDVDRFQERENLEKQLQVVRIAIPFSQYQLEKDKHDDLRAKRQKCQSELTELERAYEPLARAKEGLEARVKDIEAKETALANRATKLQLDITKCVKDLDEWKKKADDAKEGIKTIAKDENKRQTSIKKYRAEIARLQQDVAKPLPEFDRAAHSAAQREIMAQSTEISSEKARIQDEIAQLRRVIQNLDQKKIAFDNDLGRLNNVNNQRQESFRRLEPKTADAMQWIQVNQQRLGIECYDPICLALKVKDRRYVKALETLIPNESLRTIIAKTRTSFDILREHLNNSERRETYFRINLVEREAKAALETFKSPWTQEQLRKEGFDCWAIDALEGPSEILAYLCETSNIHRIPLALTADGIDVNRYETQDRGIRRYIIGSNQTTIATSRYGNGEVYTITRGLQDSKYFAEGVDSAAITRVKNQLTELRQKREMTVEDLNKLEAEINDIQEKHAPFRKKLDELDRQRQQQKQAESKHTKDKVSLEEQRRRLDEALNKPSEAERRKELSEKLLKMAARSKGQVDAIKALAYKVTDSALELTELGFELIKAKSNLQALEGSDVEGKEELRAKQEETAAAERAFLEQKAKAKEVYNVAKELLSKASEELKDAYRQHLAAHGIQEEDNPESRRPQPLEELLEEQQDLKAQLDLTAEVAGSVMDRYRQKEALQRDLDERLVEEREKVEALNERVQKLKALWQPALKSLVEGISERFSASFEEMQLQGEVHVHEDPEDYAKWGINIMISFRDNDILRPLDFGSFSGGEKSLTTICYLMALTELNNAPFTVVDEINQGMDANAERAMHNQLVRRTCGEKANQYFLVTPKLLANLDYHDKMRVLCVCNGDYAPDTLNLAELLRAKRRRSS